jgi:hypothetical protein
MDKIAELDSCFEGFISNLPCLIPDGILDVDIHLLQKLGLLTEEELAGAAPNLTRYFHVVESKEKITLYNDQFVIWVVPEKVQDEPTTIVLIAMNQDAKLRLELAFSTSGVYNTSRLVLRVLEKLLHEIQETEEFISHLQHHA